MNQLQNIKKILEEKQCQIVWQRGEEIEISRKHGIQFLLESVDQGKEGGWIADKVVGKAAAFLMVTLKVQQVFAQVISAPAAAVFQEYHIPFSYQTMTDHIINRAGDGMCPMEKKVWEAKTPAQALSLLRESCPTS